MDAGENMPTRTRRSLTRRTFLAASAATIAATKLPAQAHAGENLVYIGSTDNKDSDKGIHAALWNPQAGTLSDLRLVAPLASAGFLATSNAAGKRVLFAGHQSAPKVGAFSSYRIEPTGELKPIGTTTAPNVDMVHLALDRTRLCLIAASYGSGKILSVKVSPDGHLSEPVSQLQLSGHGPNAARQTAPHAHGVAIAPNNRFVYINDLGTDRIMAYKLNAATAELTPNDPPFFALAPGSGPRHLAFHPNGKWAYSINELDSTITLFQWNAASGALTVLANTPTLLPGGDVANNRAGEVVFDAAGRFLYACNRGVIEELVSYSIGANGHLTLIGHTPLGGKEARHFALSPDGRFLLVAEQFTNRVSIFSRDRKTGVLTPTPVQYPVNGASCVLFA
jgi:6-phosphogluconolactonase